MALLALSESFVAAVTGAGSPVSSLADAYSEAAKAMAQVFQHCSTANLSFVVLSYRYFFTYFRHSML